MTLRCVFALLLGLLLTMPLPRARAAPAGLTIVTGKGTTQTDATTARYDFGTRRMSDETPLEHTFTLRNTGTAPVTVDRLQSSCGCTTAFLAGDQDLPLTVGPGGIIPVHVTIAPHRLAPGLTEKSVWVFTHGAADASVLLEITGTLQDDSDPGPGPGTVTGTTAPSPAAPMTPAPTLPSVSHAAPQSGHPAPAFALSDAQGKPFSLAAAQGHPAALFFFCGCPWCADVARAWGRTQRGARLPQSAHTLIVYAGTGAAALAFAKANGLDLKQTTLLPDPDSRLTEAVYKLNSCPRSFALDAAGLIRYTNDHADDQPRQAPAATIVLRTFQALRR